MQASTTSVAGRLATAVTLYLVLSSFPCALSYAGDSFVGKVVAVESANRITLQQGNATQVVHINGIEVDTRAAFASEAKAAVSNLILGKTVRLRFDGYLPSGEMSGRIWVGAIGRPEEPVRDLGVELVKAGMVRSAKAYREYKYGEMRAAEAEAQQNKRGLWK